jgi:hypothetical protein
MICGFSAAAAGHILAYNTWVPGNIFLQKGNHRSHPHVSRAAGVPALDDGNGFSFEKIRL